MSRDFRTSFSVASSTGSNHGTVSADSTMTDFNPERDGAIASTHQLNDNYSQKLPQLRTTAKKYGRWAPREPTDIIINTSAIGRAFPGFSQGGSSDDSISLEVGRHPKTHLRSTSARFPRPEYSDNVESSQAITNSSVKVLGTPLRSQAKATIRQKDALRNSAAMKENVSRRDTGSHKENIPPPNTQKPAKSSPYTSHASRTTSGERRTLAELHAQVADDTDGSFIGDERPATITFQPKNTRFSSVKSQNSHLANVSPLHSSHPVNISTSHTSHAANVSTKRHEVEDALVEKLRTASGTPSKVQTKPHTNYTAQSNTPNPTQQSFLLPNMPDITEATPASFNRGTGIPLPGEEQDIYVNIDLLKEKVADLEMQLAQSRDSQSLIQGEQFKTQIERDRAIVQSEESVTKIEQLAKEIRKLRQERSSAQDERSQMQTERDRAVTQLTDTLDRNQELESEIRQLKQQQSLTRTERSRIEMERDRAIARLDESLTKNERLEKRVQELLSQNEQFQFDLKELGIEYETYKKEANQMSIDADNTTRSLEETERRFKRHEKAVAKVRELTLEISKSKQQSTKKQSLTRNERLVKDSSRHPAKEMEKSFDGNEPSMVSDDGSDFASILGPGVMETLRQQAKESRASKASAHDDTLQSIESIESSHAPSTKRPTGTQNNGATQIEDGMTGRFSIKSARRAQSQEDLTGRFSIKSAGIQNNSRLQNQDDMTGQFSIKSAGRVEKDLTIKSTTSHRRHRSETSVHTTRRRRHETDDITSAFIIPDISPNPITTSPVHPSLSASARQVLDGLCKHECTNCTICTRVASFDTKKNTEIVIPKSVPVSERMPEPTTCEEEPTIRPSVEPSLALATVIKGIEDEIAHSKMEYTRISTAYTTHDASLGMRKRTALKKRLDELLTLIERKSVQLYGLYDVLEGQKKDEDDLTEELPWEGIEETS